MSRAWFPVADWLWFLLFAATSSFLCFQAAAELGATFDEPIYLRAGLEGWRNGTHAPSLRMGTMPLPVDAVTLPLYLHERWSGVPIDLRRDDFSGYLPWARAVTLLFWVQLLFFARLLGRHFAGPWGGRLAVALLACEPNFLAHASLATTDIAAAAFLMPAVYLFAMGRGQTSWWRRIGLPALGFGLALFAKASALAYAPLCWFLIEAHRLWSSGAFALDRQGPESHAGDGLRTGLPAASAKRAQGGTWKDRARLVVRQYGPWWRDCWRIGPLGLLILFVLCGCDWRAEPSFVRWAQGLPEGAGKTVMVWLAENLTIFSNAGNGLAYQIRHNLHGHSTFLLGESSERSLWYYYPVLLAIKLPLAILILPVVLMVLRPRALGNWACVVAGGLLLYSFNCKVQIGIRLMLPWLALGIVGLAAALVNACSAAGARAGHWRPRLLQGIAGAAVAWLIAANAAAWPHGLCYVNELWGGPERGYTLVSDSNYDWGQGLRELEDWRRAHAIDNLDVWYFGSDPRLRFLPMRHLQARKMSAEELREKVQGRYLAVGTTLLYGSYLPRGSDVAGWLRELEPTARTQTFLIYDFTARSTNAPLAQSSSR